MLYKVLHNMLYKVLFIYSFWQVKIIKEKEQIGYHLSCSSYFCLVLFF